MMLPDWLQLTISLAAQYVPVAVCAIIVALALEAGKTLSEQQPRAPFSQIAACVFGAVVFWFATYLVLNYVALPGLNQGPTLVSSAVLVSGGIILALRYGLFDPKPVTKKGKWALVLIVTVGVLFVAVGAVLVATLPFRMAF